MVDEKGINMDSFDQFLTTLPSTRVALEYPMRLTEVFAVPVFSLPSPTSLTVAQMLMPRVLPSKKFACANLSPLRVHFSGT